MKTKNLCILGLVLSLLFISHSLYSQRGYKDENQPKVIGWSDDNNFLLQIMDENKHTLVKKINAKTGQGQVIVMEKSASDRINESLPKGYKLDKSGIISPDNNSAVLNKDNDLYLFTIDKNELTRLTNDSVPEMNYQFSPDGKKIAYTKSKDLYFYDLVNMKEVRLTFDATDKIYNGWASWVYMEEILGRAGHYAAFWWSPDGNKLAYLRFDDTNVPVFTLNHLDVEDGIHGTLEVTPYPKPGDPNPKVKMGVADLSTAKTTWIKTDYTVDQYIAWPFWTPDSKKLAVQILNRDQNDIKIILTDPNTGDYMQIYEETRKTWVEFYKDIYVLKNGKGFIVRSFRNDWDNLYYHAWDGKLIAQLTNFEWRVKGIDRVDEENGVVYFNGTGIESTDKQYFKVGLDGKNLMQITSGAGTHDLSISPKGTYFVDSWNNIETAGSMVVIDKKAKQINEVLKFDPISPDPKKTSKTILVEIPTSDGLFNMPATITYPLNFDETKKYPVVFTIYGGPDAGMVTNRWNGPTPAWYAQNNIITISVDHRGSGKFGKKGMDYMYRNLGKWEMLDYGDAVKWLKAKPYVDSTKIGITGSSYGGYVTCLALTKGANLWTHGIGGSSVIDWKLYDDVYTERFMDTPKDNPEGYKEASVLNYINNFKGKLLVNHGDMDDNVHMQNIIQFISKMEDANKTFEFMLYPNGRHGWGGQKRVHSTNDSHRFWSQYFFGK